MSGRSRPRSRSRSRSRSLTFQTAQSRSGSLAFQTAQSRSASKSFEEFINKLARKKTGRNVYHSLLAQMLRNYMIAALEFVRESAGVTTVAGNQAINAMFFHILAEYLKKKGLPESELSELRSIVSTARHIVESQTNLMTPTEKSSAVSQARTAIQEVGAHFLGEGAQGGGGKSPVDLAKDSLPALRGLIQKLERMGMSPSKARMEALVKIVSKITGVNPPKIYMLLTRLHGGGTRSPKKAHAPSLLSTLKRLLLGAAALGLPGAAAQEPSPSMGPSIASSYHNGPYALTSGQIMKDMPVIPNALVKARPWSIQLQEAFSASPKARSIQAKVASVSSAREESDRAMSAHPTTRGVIPWIRTQSLTAILKYVKHSNPGYTITSSKVPPENFNDYVPIESAKDQINLLHQPNYFLGNIVIETTGNYVLSDDIKEYVGYTGKEGSEKPPTAIWIEIIKASDKGNIAKGIAERDALKDSIKTLEEEHAGILIDISEKTAALSKVVNEDSARVKSQGKVLQSVGVNTAASYVSSVVVSRMKKPFQSGTTPVDDEEGGWPESTFAPVSKPPITVSHTKEINELVDLHEAAARKQKELEATRAVLEETINKSLDSREVVVRISVPASRFNTHLRELMKIYLMGDNSRLTEGIIAMPDFPWDIYHVGFYKPEQMEAAVAPMAMLQTLERRKEWGTQEWAALAEAYGKSMEVHLERAERLNVDAVEKAMSTGLVTVQEGGQLIAVHSQATKALGFVRDLVRVETGKTSDTKFRGIVEAYVKDVTFGPEHILDEAESNVIHAVGKRASEVAVDTLRTIDKAASDIAAASAAGLTLLTKIFRFSTVFAPMFGFLLFLDITVFTIIESDKDKEQFFNDIKMTTWTTVGTSAATGLLAYVGYMFGGPIGAAALPWILGSSVALIGGMKAKFVFDILKFFIGTAGGTLGTFLLIHAERITFNNTVLGFAGIVGYTATRAGYEVLRAYARRRNAPQPAILAPAVQTNSRALEDEQSRPAAAAPQSPSRSVRLLYQGRVIGQAQVSPSPAKATGRGRAGSAARTRGTAAGTGLAPGRRTRRASRR